MSRLIPYVDLRSKGVMLSKVQLWRLEKDGSFPKRVQVSASRHAWVESEIDSWIEERIANRDRAPVRPPDPARAPVAAATGVVA
jgi:prophage regulatory protein